jgi:8-hydroxy-5-deazaflavin:NADPH oxidoreductase
MNIAIVGGTGKEGQGMAARWAKAGHQVHIGSRDAERARSAADQLSTKAGAPISGGDNAWAVAQADVVVLSVPYAAHAGTLRGLAAALDGKILIDITVPLAPPAVTRVSLPPGQSAAIEAQKSLGERVKVVAALHHVSATHLADLDHALECDVLACSDHKDALEVVLGLIRDLGARAFHAGGLANAVALESLTPVLLHLGRKYKQSGIGVRFTGL